MSKTDDLKSKASIIRDAASEKENTARRVGTMFVDLIDGVQTIVAEGITEASEADVVAAVNGLFKES